MAKRNKEKTKSRARSKALVEEIATAGSELLPVIGPAMRVALKGAKAIRDDRIERRLYAFHRVLLTGLPVNEQREVVEDLLGEDSSDAYEALMVSAVDDLEEAKAEVYARVLKRLVEDPPVMEPAVRRHVLQTLKALSIDDISLLEHFIGLTAALVASESNPMYDDLRRADEAIRAILEGKKGDALTGVSVQKLVTWGLFSEPQGGFDATYAVTPVGRILADLIAERKS